MPTIVKAKKDEPTASLIRRFKKQVVADKVLPEARNKDFFIKPSEKRKEKRKERERQKRRERMAN